MDHGYRQAEAEGNPGAHGGRRRVLSILIIASAYLMTACAGPTSTAVISAGTATHLPPAEAATQAGHLQPSPHAPSSPHVPTLAPGGETIGEYDVYEIEFPWTSGNYANPWEQVEVRVTWNAPSGRQSTRGGFYYAPGYWRARFAPDEMGTWSWSARLSDGSQSQDFSGAFEVVDSEWPGFVRSNPDNPMRWVFDDGSPYYPIGIGDCLLGVDGGSPLENLGFDGEVRNASYPEGWRTDLETYLTAYEGAGFNLFRWSVDNCAFGLYETIDPSGNLYLQQEGIYGDQLVQSLRRHGFRTYMVLFGFEPPFPNGSGNAAQMDAIRRYVRYVVDRYAAYVDFWELMNEAPNPPVTIDDDWYVQVATYLREVDPYDHPISTSWQRPDLSVIDITSPHWYARENEFESDLAMRDQIDQFRGHDGKPIIFGEQGNSEQNWDERSALRMRVRSWTAFFNEAVLIFWNTSCCKDSRGGVASNIYLGPEERGFIRVLQDFVGGLDPCLALAEIEVSDPGRVRAYALRAPSVFVAYLHAYTDHTNPTSGIRVTLDSPVAGTATWVDPSSGAALGTAGISAGRQTLDAPAFTTDIALRIAP